MTLGEALWATEDERDRPGGRDAVAAGLEELIARINKTNLATSVREGMTLTEALARRDHLGWLLDHRAAPHRAHVIGHEAPWLPGASFL